MEWVTRTVVGDAQTGRIETRHVDRAGVQHLLWAQAKAVAVHAPVRGGDAVVGLERLHLTVIHGGELGGAGVVVDHQRGRHERICGQRNWNASGRVTPEVEPVVVGRCGVAPDSPDDFLDGVVEADAVVHGVGRDLDGLCPQELGLVDDVLALAVGKGGTLWSVEVNQIAQHVHVRDGVGDSDVHAVGRADDEVGGGGSASLVALRQLPGREGQLAVVPVQGDQGQSLLGEAVEPEAHGDEQGLVHEGCFRTRGLASVPAGHLGHETVRRCGERFPHLEELRVLIVKLVSTDVDRDLLQQSVSDGVHPESVRPGSGIVKEETAQSVGGIDDAGQSDRHVHRRQQIPGAGDLASELLTSKPSGVIKLHLNFADRKVGVACIRSFLFCVVSARKK